MVEKLVKLIHILPFFVLILPPIFSVCKGKRRAHACVYVIDAGRSGIENPRNSRRQSSGCKNGPSEYHDFQKSILRGDLGIKTGGSRAPYTRIGIEDSGTSCFHDNGHLVKIGVLGAWLPFLGDFSTYGSYVTYVNFYLHRDRKGQKRDYNLSSHFAYPALLTKRPDRTSLKNRF